MMVYRNVLNNRGKKSYFSYLGITVPYSFKIVLTKKILCANIRAWNKK